MWWSLGSGGLEIMFKFEHYGFFKMVPSLNAGAAGVKRGLLDTYRFL